MQRTAGREQWREAQSPYRRQRPFLLPGLLARMDTAMLPPTERCVLGAALTSMTDFGSILNDYGFKKGFLIQSLHTTVVFLWIYH